jgi:hypothetical protein
VRHRLERDFECAELEAFSIRSSAPIAAATLLTTSVPFGGR